MSTENNLLPEKNDLIVVGIGASAGGLEALQSLVSNLPPSSGMSFILAQHLSPSYRSMMVDLLEKNSTIPVLAAANNDTLQPDTFYICPPNYNIEINKMDEIILSKTEEVRHTPRPSVDMLFESIAFAKGEKAIGIILSGTGSDGSRGIRTIKGEGGFGIVQDPNTAKFDGMPNAAINSGNVDLILPPEDMGVELKGIIAFPRKVPLELETTVPRELYAGILRKIKRKHKVDFTHYKESTIMRRIERRMTALKMDQVQNYFNFLSEQEHEVEVLFNDMLIGVTSFFRDPRAFAKLQDEIRHYIANRDSKVLRVWVAGCSTGEEPYSLAIMFSEILGDKIEDYKLQIFATDIDKHAIEFARNGIYPQSALQNLPVNIRKKYFMVNGEHFEIIKRLKTHVIFSVHDISNDPPFLRLDLLSCRNLLIYFDLELQRQIFPVFHYALNPKGLLYLGQSESIGIYQENFRTISKTAKIYEAVFVGKKTPPPSNRSRQVLDDYVPATQNPTPRKIDRDKSASNPLAEIISSKLKETVLPYAILINENMDVVFTQGNNPLLIRPEGLPTNNIFQNLHPTLSIDLRSAVHLLNSGEPVVRTGFQKVFINETANWARLILLDIPHQKGMGRLILIFCQIEATLDLPLTSTDNNTESNTLAQEQERQLLKAKEQLQTVIEELETSNEEMQSMNEELQSSNEELQSSNEELETTNEELQSTNEELQTAYAELRMAYDEKALSQQKLNEVTEQLAQTNNLLQDAERMGKTGSLLWDVPQNILTWSNGAYELFKKEPDKFTPSYEAFIGLAHNEDREVLENYLNNMITGKVSEPLVYRAFDEERNLIWISLDAVVSFTAHKQAEKVLGSIKNVTEHVLNTQRIDNQTTNMNLVLNNTLNGAYIFDLKTNKNRFINQAYTNILGYELEDLDDLDAQGFGELFHPDDLDKVLAHIEEVKGSQIGDAISISYRFKHKNTGEFVTLSSNDTLYEKDPISGEPLALLGTFFETKELDD